MATLTQHDRVKEIAANFEQVRQAMGKASARSRLATKPARLVAVSKTKPVSDLQAAYATGQRHFGENYIQELVDKAQVLPADIHWHFIGHLQTNKCKMLAQIPNLWMVETIDAIKRADAMEKACQHRLEPLRVLIQVNTSGEPQKGGVEPEDLIQVAKHIASSCPHLQLAGIMTIGAFDRVEKPNPDFVKLMECKSILLQAMPELGEVEVSMGMSNDFEEAIEIGSTNVRIGSTLFGARNYNT